MSKTPKKIAEAILPTNSKFPKVTPLHYICLESLNLNVFASEFGDREKTAMDLLLVQYVLKKSGKELLQKLNELGDFKKIKGIFQEELAESGLEALQFNLEELQSHIVAAFEDVVKFKSSEDSKKKD